jgi:hypothetical protein
LSFDQLKLDEAEQIAGMVDALFRALPRLLVIFGQYRRQLEFFEMVPEQDLGIGNICLCLSLAHAANPPVKAE